MDTSNELRFNAPCYETVYCFKFKSLVFSSRVCAGAPAIPSWKFDSSNARKSVVGAKRHQDLFLKVATIDVSSGINPPMLRTWLLGKEKLFVRDGHACVAQLVYDEPGSYQTNHSRCTITTCSTKLIGPVQSAFITQECNWQFDCFLLI